MSVPQPSSILLLFPIQRVAAHAICLPSPQSIHHPPPAAPSTWFSLFSTALHGSAPQQVLVSHPSLIPSTAHSFSFLPCHPHGDDLPAMQHQALGIFTPSFLLESCFSSLLKASKALILFSQKEKGQEHQQVCPCPRLHTARVHHSVSALALGTSTSHGSCARLMSKLSVPKR